VRAITGRLGFTSCAWCSTLIAEGVSIGHHQRARPSHARGDQHLAPGGVAEHDGVARRGGLPHPLGIEIQRNVADPVLLEKPREVLAGAASAGDHHVTLVGEALRRTSSSCTERIIHSLATSFDAVAVLDEERRDDIEAEFHDHDLQHLVGGIRPTLVACDTSTSPNSPAPASAIATRSAAFKGCCRRRATGRTPRRA